MLEALSEGDRVSASDVLRQLLQREFRARFGNRMPPRQEQIRRRLDELPRRDDVSKDLLAQAARCVSRRRSFDKTHPSGLALGAEEIAYEALQAFEDKNMTSRAEKELIEALHRLENFYLG